MKQVSPHQFKRQRVAIKRFQSACVPMKVCVDHANHLGRTTELNSTELNVGFFSIGLGLMATVSSVLYANMNHPELKIDYPNWPERHKQILKKWRALSTELKKPILAMASANRSAMKKAQQVSHSFSRNYIRRSSPTFLTSRNITRRHHHPCFSLGHCSTRLSRRDT